MQKTSIGKTRIYSCKAIGNINLDSEIFHLIRVEVRTIVLRNVKRIQIHPDDHLKILYSSLSTLLYHV